ncbi:MAG: SH3 domain-containing protein [Nostocaceae cyanobacterium]|nr:SH3 domain-containing protein [Nostocaceae cyanobacterium]
MTAENQPTVTPSVLNRSGVLKSNYSSITRVNIRSGPSLNYSILHKGNVGDKVTVIDEEKPSGDSHTWYKIKYGQQFDNIGWVRDDVIKLSETPPKENTTDAETLVHFATNAKTVRIYGLKQRYMNIYDNQKEVTELSGVPAARIPKVDSDKDDAWISYMAVKDEKSYYVRFLPFSATELIISNSNDGKITLREYGLRAWGLEYENKL